MRMKKQLGGILKEVEMWYNEKDDHIKFNHIKFNLREFGLRAESLSALGCPILRLASGPYGRGVRTRVGEFWVFGDSGSAIRRLSYMDSVKTTFGERQ